MVLAITVEVKEIVNVVKKRSSSVLVMVDLLTGQQPAQAQASVISLCAVSKETVIISTGGHREIPEPLIP